jgi:hypothetical protein
MAHSPFLLIDNGVVSSGYHSAVVIELHGRQIMVVWGGLSDQMPITNLETYDISANRWQSGNPAAVRSLLAGNPISSLRNVFWSGTMCAIWSQLCRRAVSECRIQRCRKPDICWRLQWK